MSATLTRDRLLAIVAADGVGYSRLMALDDAGTVASLDAARAVFRRHIEAHGGRVIDMAGDAVLAAFETATAAVKAALAVQAEQADVLADTPEERRLRYRIGIHLGDVIEKADGTVYGSGVNIAARLESLAPVGGVAVSQAVRGAVAGRVAVAFDDLGPQTVKNIAEPVRTYALRLGVAAVAPAATARRPRRVPLLAATLVLALGAIGIAGWVFWPRGETASASASASASTRGAGSPVIKQTLAVLPFASRSSEPGNELFAESLSEELMGLLSRVQGLRVTARGSAFNFKGKQMPMNDIARQLGVAYLVDGTVRRDGQRLRIGVELVRGSGHHGLERYVRPRAQGRADAAIPGRHPAGQAAQAAAG